MTYTVITDNRYWRTAKGELLPLSQMETSHLWNTGKMLYNHLADQYKLPYLYTSNRYKEFRELVRSDPIQAIAAVIMLGEELATRQDRKYYMVLPSKNKLQELL